LQTVYPGFHTKSLCATTVTSRFLMRSKLSCTYTNGTLLMGKPTLPVVYNKLFEDGDFYITDQEPNMIGFERDSVIIHPCPHPNKKKPSNWPDIPFNLTMVLPYGVVEVCQYCSQVPSDALIAVYKLQNFDHFASDAREEWEVAPWNTATRKYRSRIM